MGSILSMMSLWTIIKLATTCTSERRTDR